MSFCVDAGIVCDEKGKRKRHRKFFATKKEAKEYAKKMQAARVSQGALAFSLTPRQQIEATLAFKSLSPYGVTLSDAISFFVKHSRPKGGRKIVSELVSEFLEAKTKSGKKPRYLKELRCKLNKFTKTFGNVFLNEIPRTKIEEWLDAQNFALMTRKNYLRDLGMVFKFAVNRGYCADSAIDQIEQPRLPETDIKIFTVSEASKLLFAANRRQRELSLVPYLAIGLFAGLRASELAKLDWDQVNLHQKTIEVTAENAKTSRSRFVHISDNLAAWLKRYEEMAGPVAPKNLYRRIKKLLGTAEIQKWPENGLRHSFGSYHYAFHKNANLTASDLGHESTKMLFKHYRKSLDPKTAAEYWEIRPPKRGWMIRPPSYYIAKKRDSAKGMPIKSLERALEQALVQIKTQSETEARERAA